MPDYGQYFRATVQFVGSAGYALSLTVVYANLGDRDDIEEVKFDTTKWANGTVRRYNSGQQGRPGSINVNFDDGTDNVRISFYDQSVNYVEPAFIERI
jgi:hypothetical protein